MVGGDLGGEVGDDLGGLPALVPSPFDERDRHRTSGADATRPPDRISGEATKRRDGASSGSTAGILGSVPRRRLGRDKAAEITWSEIQGCEGQSVDSTGRRHRVAGGRRP